MINLLSATPGSGKTLLATELLLNLSRSNVSNLKHNYFYAKAFFEKIIQLDLSSHLNSILIETGQGLERTSEIIFLEPDYFDFLKTEYFINVISNPDTDDIVNNFPAFYYERIAILNLIIEKLNTEQNTKFDGFKPVRTIYSNIANLKLIQVRPLPENCDWRNTPEGSFFAIDEAQLINIFSDEARGIDPIVKDLTIHRHKGYDFWFITQEPSFVHKYIRKLASYHVHLVNIFGWEQSMKMEWSVVQDSPNAIKSIARAENLSRWRFPQHVYNLYKSTTINTRVKRIPKKLVITSILAIVLIIAAILVLSFGGAMNNPLINTLTGSSPTTEKKNDTTTNVNAGQPVKPSSNAQQTPNKTIQTKDDPNNILSASESSTQLSATSEPEPTYDITDPNAFNPSFTPSVVNARVFSGCFCTSKTCTAYDSQGTKINGFDKNLCRKIMRDSSARPFDYFSTRNNGVNNNAQLPNKTDSPQPNQPNISPAYQAQNQVEPNLQRPINGANSL